MTEKIELLIGGKKFANWLDLEIKLSLDTFDSVGFSAPFEPTRPEFRKIFRPFSYAPVQVLLDGDPLFTGTMVSVEPTFEAEQRSVKVQCYATPGVLCDCTAATAKAGYQGRRSRANQHQALGLSLVAIAKQLCDPFEIDCVFADDTGADFYVDDLYSGKSQATLTDVKTSQQQTIDCVGIETDEKIHSFLVDLAKQRGLVVTNSETGKLLFWRARKSGTPVVQFAEGRAPLTKVSANFESQEYYSQITGYVPVKRRRPGGSSTVLNRWLGGGLESGADPINTFRPITCKLDDTERANAPEAMRAKIGRMFGNCATYTVEDLPTWRDPKGNVWEPNTTLTLTAPSAMVYRESELLIRDVTLRQSSEKLTASLDLVLPAAFSGEVPDSLPWLEQ